MDTAYISHLTWSSGGYVDVYGIQADAGQVFLRRINTRQIVENANEGAGGGNNNQHDGSTITLAATGLSTFTAIRLDNKLGRFHLTGMSFSSNRLQGSEGTGMVHPGQLSLTGAGSGLNADLLDGSHASAFVLKAGDTMTGALTIDRPMQDGTNAYTSPHLILSSTNTTDTTGFVGMVFDTSTSANYGWSYGAQRTTDGNGDLIWRNHDISTAGVERMRLTDAGNVGIGTSNPQGVLHIQATNTGLAPLLRLGNLSIADNTTKQSGLIFELTDTVGEVKEVSRIASYPEGSNAIDAGLAIFTRASNSVAERIRITGTGNVGIGTTSPYSKLDVGTPLGNDGLLTISGRYDLGGTSINFRSGHGANANVWDMARIHITDDGNYNGRIEFRTATDGQEAPTTKMVIKHDGNVGIGTASPVAKLAVEGAAYFADDIYLRDGATASGDVLVRIYDSSDDGIIDVYRNNSVVNRIHGNGASFFTAGNVGIGTTSPENTLSLGTVGSFDQDVNSLYVGNNFTGTGTNFRQTGNYAQQLVFDTALGNIIFRNTSATGTAGNAITFSERMRISADGNVGIGTTSPAQKLDVNGTAHIGNIDIGAGQYQNRINASGDASMVINSNGGVLSLNEDNNNNVLLGAGGGNVGIGTTSPSTKLHVTGDMTLNRNATGSGATLTLSNGTEGQEDYSSLMFANVTNHSNFRKGGIAYRTNGTGWGRGDIYFLQRSDNTTTNADLSNHAMVIANNGNIGIGTASPQKKLHIQSNGSDYGTIRIYRDSTTQGEVSIGFFGKSNSNTNEAWIIGEGGWAHPNDFVIGNENSGAGGNVRMLIQRDGNVGIGTTSPSSKLEIAETSTSFNRGLTISQYSTDAAGGLLQFKKSRGTQASPTTVADGDYILTSQSQVYDGTNYLATAGFGFRVSGTVATGSIPTDIFFNAGSANDTNMYNNADLFIKSSGNVGIGTTSPGAKLDVNGNTNITGNLTVTNLINKPTADSVVITQNDVPILSTFKATGTDGENTFVGRSGNTTLTGSTTSTQGSYNTAIGQGALTSLTVGFENVAVGNSALKNNTEGYHNVAVGLQALRDNNTGYYNTAVGKDALRNNTSGSRNTAMGLLALSSNTTGQFNTSVGVTALTNNTSGNFNTAIGDSALNSNTLGSENTAVGIDALEANTTGGNNNAVGRRAGYYAANGTTQNATGSNSIFIGSDTRPLGDNQTNQVVIGHTAIGIGSNTVTLGNDSIVTTALKGNVGIGTTSPGSKLHVVGSITTQAAATTSTATQIPVFTTNPASTAQAIVTRTPAELRSDIGAAASSHTHGDISNAGAITSTAVTPGANDYIIISDSTASNVLKRGILINSAIPDGTFLANNGTFRIPSKGSLTNVASTRQTGTTFVSIGSASIPAFSTHLVTFTGYYDITYAGSNYLPQFGLFVDNTTSITMIATVNKRNALTGEASAIAVLTAVSTLSSPNSNSFTSGPFVSQSSSLFFPVEIIARVTNSSSSAKTIYFGTRVSASSSGAGLATNGSMIVERITS
jgi:hypothetical protein